MNLDLVVRGGTVVDEHTERRADLGITDGKVVAVGAGLPAGRAEIDASGRLVLPGGVDIHCHLAQISAKGTPTADDFFTGSRSAAHGGTTSILAFAAQHRGRSIVDVVDQGLADVSRAAIDAGLHLIVTDFTAPDAEKGLQYAVDHGITSLKVFLTYDKLRLADAELITVLDTARRLGMTVMVHAEHHGIISWNTGNLLAEGRTDPAAHGAAHHAKAEAAGVAQVADLADYLGMPIYLVHLSSREALAALRAARARGIELIAETCPHYLTLDAAAMAGPLEQAVQAMCSPPLRSPADQDALWQALADGELQVVGSDHAPYRLDGGKLPNGVHTTFTECANGIPGIELRLPLLFSHGVRTGRIAVTDLVRLACAEPARQFGLTQKGSLGVGSDADLAIWDPSLTRVVRHADLHDAMDHTPYEGMELTGWPVLTLSHGEVVAAAPGAPTLTGIDPVGTVGGRGRYLGRRGKHAAGS